MFIAFELHPLEPNLKLVRQFGMTSSLPCRSDNWRSFKGSDHTIDLLGTA